MIRGRIVFFVAVLSVILNVFLVYLFFIRGENPKVSVDNRVSIPISGGNRDFVLHEMRSFLECVKLINEGLLEDNPDKIFRAASVSGAVHQVPKGLLRTLPLGFKMLGFSTHRRFDVLAQGVKRGFDKRKVQQEMGLLLNNCVACHASYKFE